MKMRSSIVNITNELAEKCTLNVDITLIYNLILDYCKKNNTLHTPRKNTYDIKNGVLSINGQNIERVDPLPGCHIVIEDEAYYWEGKKLAAQGL